ncbi:DUF4245 domain-containing protein [Evansella sp. LMS18]|uniref:DUF4245 domain-containing protein n=1 Tax=Evansella sp. LMS18 TaxID=2924033 RepID=UPI0020CFEC4B|nr:DUF4245 domain-containing protein [Evansella sp. LMS18]UTR09102.1 DUF4245 domain-containing protein [Evansella sp. LMS18]
MTFNQAVRELPFPVLLPDDLPEGWEIAETVYDEELLVVSYDTGDGGRIELVQDQNIQGLELYTLRNYIISGSTSQDLIESGITIQEFSDFIGELISFDEPVPTIQYTFVKKKNLFGSLENIPVYQVIGKEATLGDIRKFTERLEAVPQ